MFFLTYVKNLFDNFLDIFFCYFYDLDVLENFSDFNLKIKELFDIFKFLFNFRMEEFFFFLSDFFSKNKKKYSIFFYFFSLISDIYFVFVAFIISHLWLSVKIYNDYVHNYYRRNFLKVLSMFFLFFSLLFFIYFFFIV